MSGISVRKSTNFTAANSTLERMRTISKSRPSNVHGMTHVGDGRDPGTDVLYSTPDGDTVELSFSSNKGAGVVPSRNDLGYMLTPKGSRVISRHFNNMDGTTIKDCSYPSNYNFDSQDYGSDKYCRTFRR